MDLRRLKTVFIVVLIIFNLVLGIILYNAIRQEKEIANVTKSNVERILQRDMIYFAPNLEIPSSPEIHNVYLERMSADNEEFAVRMLGGKYSVNDSGVYKSGEKSLEISGDEFVYKNSAPEKTVSDFTPKGVEQVCRKEMEALGIKSELYMFGGINQIENGMRAVFTMQHENDVFFDAYISFDISNNGISSISGKNIISNMTASARNEKYFNISSVLLELPKSPHYDKSKKTVIMSIKHGYYIGGNIESYSNILAIPVWQIVTDSGEILYYDARNGEYIG